MSEPSAKYFIYSTSNNENIGIWLFYHQQPEQTPEKKFVGQPVRVKADLVEWEITPPAGGGGPHHLGPSPYKYTAELEGEVFATNNPEADREWFLIPGNGKDIYLIAVDPEGKYVWTAVESGKPVRVEPFRVGDAQQVFRIVPALDVKE